MKVLVFHNPKAGKGHFKADNITAEIKKHGHEVHLQSTKDPEYARALELPADLILIAGGDGTINKIAQHLHGKQTPISILPIGTANNIAKNLHLKPDLEHLISLWEQKNIVSFDTGLVSFPVGQFRFYESFGLGLFTHLMTLTYNLNFKKIIKFESTEHELNFSIELFKNLLPDHKPKYYEIILDGKDYSGNYLIVEIMNIQSIGPNLLMAPEADFSDGYFDVILVKEEDKEEFLHFLDGCLDLSCPPVLPFIRAKNIQIRTEKKAVHVDDVVWSQDDRKLSVKETYIELSIEVKPDGLKFISG